MTTLDNTLGALFVGFSVSTVAYGILIVQVYNYYRRYPSDKVGYKATVMLLLLLETAHQVFIGHTLYYYSITNFMNIRVLSGNPIWSIVFQVLIGSVAGFVVKFSFALRVWRFSDGNVWLTAFLLLVTFGQLGLVVTFTVKSYGFPVLPAPANIRILGLIALGASTLDDVGIAASLCYYLQTMRSSYAQTNSLIKSLTLNAVNTGALTSALSFSTLLMYQFMPTNFISMGCYLVLSKLYAVSFVAALNTRQIIRGRGTECDAKRFSIATDQRRCSHNIPLHSPTVLRDPLDVEFHGGEDKGSSAPRPGEDLVLPRSPNSSSMAYGDNLDINFMQRQDRPDNTAGW